MKLIVAKDGTGDYSSLQAAVDAAPENGPAVILVIISSALTGVGLKGARCSWESGAAGTQQPTHPCISLLALCSTAAA